MNLEALALSLRQQRLNDGAWREDEPAATVKRKRRPKVARPFGGKAPSCECGECRKCKNREGMRAARARAAEGLAPAPRGRPLDPHRRCLLCLGRIARVNNSGVCKRCQGVGLWRHKKGARQWVFSHGGGI